MENVCFSFEIIATSVFNNQLLDTESTELALWAADLGSMEEYFPVYCAQRTLNRNAHAQ